MQLETKVPNIFNQYFQPENRVTNALLQVLSVDINLLRGFVKEIMNIDLSLSSNARLSTLKEPYDEYDRKNLPIINEEGLSIPDAFIYDEENNLNIFIESKLDTTLYYTQLKNHCRAYSLKSFSNFLICISTDKEQPGVINDILKEAKNCKVIWLPWKTVYHWACEKLDDNICKNNYLNNFLCTQLKGYLEMYENLSDFAGINFQKDIYNYPQAKSFIKSLIEKVLEDINEIYPQFKIPRPKITDNKTYVWDVLSDGYPFNSKVHLTFEIHNEYFALDLTLPNMANWKIFRRKLKDRLSEFKEIFSHLVQNFKNYQVPPEIGLYVWQSHAYKPYKLTRDGKLEFKIDVCPFIKKENILHKNIKQIPFWFDAFVNLCQTASNVHLEMQISIIYYYIKHSIIKKPEFANEVIKAAKALKPLYDYLTCD